MSSKRKISMGRAERASSIPCRAYSYSFFPLTFNAEYMGGTCKIFPLNCCKISSNLAAEKSGTGFVSNTFPLSSPVSVRIPKIPSAR